MSHNELLNNLKKVFEENGLEIFDGDEFEPLEIDSLRFIAIIVSVENEFNIEVPEQYLSRELINSFNDFYEMLCEVASKK